MDSNDNEPLSPEEFERRRAERLKNLSSPEDRKKREAEAMERLGIGQMPQVTSDEAKRREAVKLMESQKPQLKGSLSAAIDRALGVPQPEAAQGSQSPAEVLAAIMAPHGPGNARDYIKREFMSLDLGDDTAKAIEGNAHVFTPKRGHVTYRQVARLPADEQAWVNSPAAEPHKGATFNAVRALHQSGFSVADALADLRGEWKPPATRSVAQSTTKAVPAAPAAAPLPQPIPRSVSAALTPLAAPQPALQPAIAPAAPATLANVTPQGMAGSRDALAPTMPTVPAINVPAQSAIPNDPPQVPPTVPTALPTPAALLPSSRATDALRSMAQPVTPPVNAARDMAGSAANASPTATQAAAPPMPPPPPNPPTANAAPSPGDDGNKEGMSFGSFFGRRYQAAADRVKTMAMLVATFALGGVGGAAAKGAAAGTAARGAAGTTGRAAAGATEARSAGEAAKKAGDGIFGFGAPDTSPWSDPSGEKDSLGGDADEKGKGKKPDYKNDPRYKRVKKFQYAMGAINDAGGSPSSGQEGSASKSVIRQGVGIANHFAEGYEQIIKGEGARGMATLVSAMASIPGKFREFGDELLRSKRQIAEHSGSLTVAMMKLDADRYGRSSQLANMTARSTSTLAESQSAREDAGLVFQAAIDNATNRVTASVNDAVTFLIKALGTLPVASALLKWLADQDAKGDSQLPVDLLKEIVKNNGFDVKRELPPIGRKAKN